jgi:acyl-coenzyme A synthetase/AMP-(fatty) acid ligase
MHPIILFAIVRLGAILTSSSPDYGCREMLYVLKTSSAKLVFADQGSMSAVSKAARILDLPRNRSIAFDAGSDTTFKDLISIGRSVGRQKQIPFGTIPPGQSNKAICAYLSFNSGTTSLLKGVSHLGTQIPCFLESLNI